MRYITSQSLVALEEGMDTLKEKAWLKELPDSFCYSHLVHPWKDFQVGKIDTCILMYRSNLHRTTVPAVSFFLEMKEGSAQQLIDLMDNKLIPQRSLVTIIEEFRQRLADDNLDPECDFACAVREGLLMAYVFGMTGRSLLSTDIEHSAPSSLEDEHRFHHVRVGRSEHQSRYQMVRQYDENRYLLLNAVLNRFAHQQFRQLIRLEAFRQAPDTDEPVKDNP
jgi:hypothetical protein